MDKYDVNLEDLGYHLVDDFPDCLFDSKSIRENRSRYFVYAKNFGPRFPYVTKYIVFDSSDFSLFHGFVLNNSFVLSSSLLIFELFAVKNKLNELYFKNNNKE